jgi:hypothetical protein
MTDELPQTLPDCADFMEARALLKTHIPLGVRWSLEVEYERSASGRDLVTWTAFVYGDRETDRQAITFIGGTAMEAATRAVREYQEATR